MIQIENLKAVLSEIGFIKEAIGDYFQIDYGTCIVAVDFDNKKIIYPEGKGLKVNDKTTSNFEHPENFVVLECVCRLLEKGYRPEHIELEPRWTLGHDAKGGKADIQVKDDEGKSLLIIECKTAGTEFNKEKKNTEEDGGQLFSYWQQEISTRWLALYASDWKENALSYNCLVINCTDDANIAKMAEKDNDVKLFSKARNDKERFEVWEETYQKQWLDDVIFNEESQAYKIGIPPLRKKKLKDFTPDDRIVNRFEEILRHNNVSDKENAFNRLVALFICKLVDEIKKQDFDEVDFQYKQGQDTYESLQDRLQHLHQQGMEEFMKEKIFYVEADYAERLFMQYTGRQRKAAIEDLNRTIRILKFYSNNDFAFKDVHNEELFYQNGKILVEVVQLFQPYRIVYPSKHQFLGDLFEQLLNKGFKQNEGQFFTPTPITRFIWDSLPLQHYVSNRDLPRIIDYACGAGHFLTEAVEAVNAVRKDADNTWVEKHVFGIEKDYRLARVSKISMFMNGAGGANIIFGDGLENYADKGIENETFDILVANPPYSVSGFKQHLKLKNNSFCIIDKITSDGSEIETLFVERAAQLLKPQGIAAVILPASILSNSSGSYIAAREQLLKNFMLRGIVNFGSKTFGATGTNTVVLFLERYNEPPKVSKMTEDIVDGILSNNDCSEWQDKEIMEAYLAHQGIEDETYKQFLSRSIPWELLQQDNYFKMYVDVIANSSITYPKNATTEKKAVIRLNRFYDYALSIERDKLYYFTLAHNQKTLVISAPTDNKEQKTFLGYDWSNRKGAEGIIINKKGGQLYDDNDRFASNTLASLIRYTFYGDIDTTLPEDVEKYAKTYRLRDMIDFSQAKSDKIIRTTNIKKFEMKSIYPLVKIGEVVDINQQDINPTLSPNKEFVYVDIASVENGTGNMSFDYKILGKDAPSRARRIVSKGNTILSTVRPNLKAFAFAEKDYNDTVFSTGFAILMPKDINALLPKLLYIYFMNMESLMQQIIDKMPKGQYPSINKADIESFMIPLPPLDIQQKIVDECKKVDEEYLDSKRKIETLVNQIDKIYNDSISTNTKVVKLSDICNMRAGKFVAAADIKDVADEKFKYPCYGGNGMRGYTDTMTNEGEYTIIGRQGALCGNVCTAKGQFHATEHAVVVYPNPYTDPVWLRYHLEKMNLNQYATGTAQPGLSVQKILELQCSVPLFETQKKVAEAIKKYEQDIQEAEEFCRSSYSRKQAILDKYLK
jgi:type I restriction-modification system DNA methylase subunit